MKKKQFIKSIIVVAAIITVIVRIAIVCVVVNFVVKLNELSSCFEEYSIENPENWIRLDNYEPPPNHPDERLGIWPDSTVNVVYALNGVSQDYLLYIIDNRMMYTHDEYLIINAGKEEPILNESFSVKEIVIELDGKTITVADSTIIDKLVDLRRSRTATELVYKNGLNGELYGYVHPQTNETFSSFTNAFFRFDSECEFYWKCRIDVKDNGKIYFVYAEEKTHNDDSLQKVCAVEVTDILKDILLKPTDDTLS